MSEKKRESDSNETVVKGWHVNSGSLLGGQAIPEDGHVLRYDGEIVPLQTGLYVSERILDALPYGRGAIVCAVELGGVAMRWPDKVVGRQRVILWRKDCHRVFRAFARWCALRSLCLATLPQETLSVVERYLVDGPPGDLTREHARLTGAKLDWATDKDAAWFSAHDAIFSASWDGAIDEHGYPPHIAARDAAWQSAFALGRAQAMQHGSEAGSEVWEAERDAQERQLKMMVETA